jgi:hypothetical protein
MLSRLISRAVSLDAPECCGDVGLRIKVSLFERGYVASIEFNSRCTPTLPLLKFNGLAFATKLARRFVHIEALQRRATVSNKVVHQCSNRLLGLGPGVRQEGDGSALETAQL